jgi:hypothetical protein
MKRSLLIASLLLTGCGAIGADPAQCTPACGNGTACCEEPTHAPADGGPSSHWVCVTPSNGACPALP